MVKPTISSSTLMLRPSPMMARPRAATSALAFSASSSSSSSLKASSSIRMPRPPTITGTTSGTIYRPTKVRSITSARWERYAC